MARIHARIEIYEDRLERQTGPMFRRKHRSLTRRIANQARADVPVRTGALGRSVHEEPMVYTPFHVSGGVGAGGGAENVNYAAAVHEGRDGRGRRIYARHASALHFFWNGREVFRRSVRMSSMRARPFLRNAAKRVIAADPDIELLYVDLDA
jgi:hypothetical protein